jgi:hypothetical protein
MFRHNHDSVFRMLDYKLKNLAGFLAGSVRLHFEQEFICKLAQSRDVVQFSRTNLE